MAKFVMNEDYCTEQELWKKMSESIYDDNDNVCDALFDGTADSDSDSCSDVLISQLDQRNSMVRSLSKKSQSLHEKVSLSAVKGRGCPSQQQRTNAYKDILADVKLILDNPKCTKDDLVTMMMAVSKVKDEIMEKGRREDGEKQYGTRLVWGDDNDKKRSPQKRNLGPCG